MAEVTIWGHGEDKLGSRMDRAVEYIRRVADPEHPWSYWHARRQMLPRASEKGSFRASKIPITRRAKKPTVAKNKKSA